MPPPPPPPDRIDALHLTNALVGIDFVYVFPNQTKLAVFFHPSSTQTAQQILGAITVSQIRIASPSGGERLPVVPLDPALPPAFAVIDGRSVLIVNTAQPGDFSRYRFRLDHPRIDPFFQEVGFSFKANCPSLLDCEPPPHECPDDSIVDFPVNYLARDFWSFRQALLDFASERYPDWQDRSEADFGMMLAEMMSAMGDEFAYIQDRNSREAYLGTASQRRSLRRHTRLVDYHIHDGLGATTWLDFEVNADTTVSPGTVIWETVLKGVEQDPQKRKQASRAIFEVGRGLASGNPAFSVLPPPVTVFQLRFNANELLPYQWDNNQTCLPAGSTFLHIQGNHAAADLLFDDFSDPNLPRKWVVLKTKPFDLSVAPRTWLVPLIAVTDETDSLPFPIPFPTPRPITRLEWPAEWATPFEMEYDSLRVRGNIVPATAGQTLHEQFQIEPLVLPVNPARPFAVERQGPLLNVSPSSSGEEEQNVGQPQLNPALLFTLPGSEERDLVWLGLAPDAAAPEIRLFELQPNTQEWNWKRAFLGSNSSQSGESHFTLDDGAWRRVAGYRRVDESGIIQEYVHQDYASGRGCTIRFGDGEFGKTPDPSTVFEAIYRLGHGRADNVAAGSLTDFDPADVGPAVTAVTNPFDVINAIAKQTPEEIRQLAPEAFRAITFRAVRAEDYAEAIERLEWVQRAGAQFRWTGSWLTLFATPDPEGSFGLTRAEKKELEEQLDRFRMTGREAWGRDPVFATIDFEINICVEPFAFRGEVVETVLEALFGRRGLHSRPGFFSPDNFSFGTPLDRSNLEAAIQDVPGVRAVETIRIRRRGWFDWRDFVETTLKIGADEIIRVENNRDFPERGAVRIIPHGGA
jgi:hypothetical protein